MSSIRGLPCGVDRLASKGIPEFATCSITEQGLCACQAQPYGSLATHARELLLELTNTKGFTAPSFRITIIALRRTVQSLQRIASTTSIERAQAP